MTRKEEHQLGLRARSGDVAAQHELVLTYLPLAKRTARLYASIYPNLGELDDLRQDAAVGLLEAVRHYDPEKGPFRNFALYWIRVTIARSVKTGKGVSGTGPEDFEQEVYAPISGPRQEEIAATRWEVDELLGRLSTQERRVITMRYGLDGERAYKPGEIATALGISANRVHGLHSSALARMRGDKGAASPALDRMRICA